MELLFWPLDISYDVSEEASRIFIWSITKDNRRVLLIDESFHPYFYVLPKNSVIDSVIKHLKSLEKAFPSIICIKKESKFYFGKPVTAIKVTVKSPSDINKVKDKIKHLPDVLDVLEADIRFYMRYMIDKNVYPCSWHKVSVTKLNVNNNLKVDAIYKIEDHPKNVEDTSIPNLKILSFDVEYHSPKGTPKPDKNPIVIISTATTSNNSRQFTADEYDEKELLTAFTNHVLEYDPDIIVGYNSNRFVWPYILSRAKKLGVSISVSREFSTPQTSVYGHISIAGRANLDMLDYAEELYEVKIKTLQNVAEYLGINSLRERLLKSPWLYQYWSDPAKRDSLKNHSYSSAKITLEIAKKALPFAIQLSTVTGLPLDQVLAAAVGFRVEWYLIRQAFLENELIPNRVERPYTPYRGALVLKPIKGLHENVAVIDFSSMYPSIMIKYNISPDTYVDPNESLSPTEYYVAPEVGHRFRKSPPGFYKRVLEKLISLRNEIRLQLRTMDVNSLEYILLNNRQKALKVIANACYGYTGWFGARWYMKQCAEATTAFGRKTISEAIKLAKEIGLQVIYGDTDSLFVRYDADKVSNFIFQVQNKIGLDIKIDKIYVTCLFTEAAKRYAGLLPDGRVEVVGFEAVRGDWCELAQEVQFKVIELILKEKSPQVAVNYLRKVINTLKSQKIPLEKLVIWKTLSKSIDEYEVDAPHVVVAKILRDEGFSLEIGDKVGYIITKGTSRRLADRAKPYFMVDYKDVDVNYYISNQIVPSALRVLSIFDYTEKSIMTQISTKTLDVWFRK